jgi:GNAT superfamily N-acetyltransferase
MKAREFIPAEKPRNFVAKNAKMGGAGQHKDKKKAEKQGDLKHKNKQFEQGVAEGVKLGRQRTNEKINPEILSRKFRKQKDLGWYRLEAQGDALGRAVTDPPTLKVVAKLVDKSKPENQWIEIGDAEFFEAPKEGPYAINNTGDGGLIPEVSVHPEYQRKGIATEIYKFIRELGNDIVRPPSGSQSDDAVGLWGSFQKQGVADEGVLSFLKTEPERKKWNPAKDSRVTINKKDNEGWIKLLIDKHRRGIELTDREWNSIEQWKLKRAMSAESAQIQELSTDLLGRYKKAASDDATAADKAGDYDKGHKRFKGIVKATNKQFDNDAKKRK